MSKFQKIKYASVDDLLLSLPKEELDVVNVLRGIVLECLPGVKEKLSYNVPYYTLKRRVCYIWPSHVPWGNVPLSGVSFGFVHGNLLSDEANYLNRGNRKQVYTLNYTSVDAIDEAILKMFLFEAAHIDARL